MKGSGSVRKPQSKRRVFMGIEKALGMKKEKLFELADVAMDAAHGRPVK